VVSPEEWVPARRELLAKEKELTRMRDRDLAALRHQGVIETWHDRGIGAGKDFNREISENLEKAHIILLVVSSDFIASPYCYSIEMRRADGAARERRGARHSSYLAPVLLAWSAIRQATGNSD
jgi:hypothetical protein